MNLEDISTDLVGQQFGRLIVVAKEGTKNRNVYFKCLCECGNERSVNKYLLVSGKTRSCGCLRKEIMRTTMTTHGHAQCGKNTLEYRVWAAMKSRCNNPNNEDYPNYGGRGIKVCDEWSKDFYKFYQDIASEIGVHPGKGYSIDRIDTNGNYEPGNVRWTTGKIQARNRRTTVKVNYRGQEVYLIDLSEASGVAYETLYQRIHKYGWDIERALTKPSRIKNGVDTNVS